MANKQVNPLDGVPTGIRRGGLAGRPKKLGKAVEIELHQRPTELERQAMAEALGVPLDSIPDFFPSFPEMLAWRARLGAATGNIDWWREVMDRVAPKPRRTEISGPGGGPLRGHISHGPPSSDEEAAAEEFYRGLNAPADEDGAPDFGQDEDA